MGKVVFENSSYGTYGDLPAVGSYAPDISLVDTRLRNVTFNNWSGMRKIMNVVLSIDTEVCARSIVELDRLCAEQEDLAVLLVSCDLPFAHERFVREQKLENTAALSAIRHGGFGENYGVQITEGPLAGMYSPALVVIDENNTVVHTENIEELSREPDYPAAFRALGVGLAV
ncbi:MAG: thiol peroxidase [Pseudomonadota bacterium]